ncbi:beta-mannosidase [Paraliobacillus sediminis]|uniref:beta-mannosidase n=1 Tax=Paraliobacillus sediminis TaxID=1885916 RepID=UPI000E3BA085|nr:glycoside hydrolase family 2 protein [Paraliobacillus sediminis]
MNEISLNGFWKMKDVNGTEWIEASVPGSVMNDLLNNGLIDDPFYRDNEDQAYEIALKDYYFTRTFDLNDQFLNRQNLLLKCVGLDTIAEVKLNGHVIANTDNMHRLYEIDIKPYAIKGRNEILIRFYSPIKYITEKQNKRPLVGVNHAVEGYPHIRKAHSMYGWDWGPKIPDLGIWRDISVLSWDSGRIDNVHITQVHTDDQVEVNVRVEVSQLADVDSHLHVKLTSPSGEINTKKVTSVEGNQFISFTVSNPKLWWPNGYGDQALYQVDVESLVGGEVSDEKVYKIGLRTIEVKNEPDEWGKSFEFVVNGHALFMMGANYIPEDNILARTSKERTEVLIHDCVEANFNMIRVWGGGYYPDDYFYDLCDAYGLIVWQDFMFACSIYELTENFEATVYQEAIDNVKRIRHHASLGIWCGNNEVEEAWENWGWPKERKLREDYIKLFENYLPEIVKEHDPKTFYWSSSPSSEGGFVDPRNPDVGDVHYWDVWHGQKPFTDYRNFYFRFCSEFGFQSFPALKTIESYTEPKDRNIFSRIMEKHQKNEDANGKILYYLSENFLYPKDFDSLVYTSQLLQAEAIKYGVEHWRRNRGRCMGSLYWQLNDCWPVASWSSIDYYGRWKALHYFTKKFYAPILLSVEEEGKCAAIHVTNDTFKQVNGEVKWKLCSNNSEVIVEGSLSTIVDPLSAKKCKELDFTDILTEERMRDTYLECTMYLNDSIYSSTTVLFTKPKHFEFLDPKLSIDVKDQGDSFEVAVKANNFTKYIELSADVEAKFSDNYFDLSSGDVRQITVLKDSLDKNLSADQFRENITVRSIYHIAD